MSGPESAKRVKKECSYGEKCFRLNPIHFREYSHRHLESILDAYSGSGEYCIPDNLCHQQHMIKEQLEVIVEKKLYEPVKEGSSTSTSTNAEQNRTQSTRITANESSMQQSKTNVRNNEEVAKSKHEKLSKVDDNQVNRNNIKGNSRSTDKTEAKSSNKKGTDYRPVVEPTRRAENFLKVVLPRGNMAAKHAVSAPYHIFYTTISDAKETHHQPYSITFLEILDRSLGELKCSLQINFMVELGWLLAQYYFAGYSEKRLTILYGEDGPELRTINQKKPHVDAHRVNMGSPFGKHHTKMMLLCYEDGSLRVVISTANLYIDDWENRTQGLWFSPNCPELPPEAMPFEGESPTGFKKSLLRYLNHYQMPQLAYYLERVKRCDFSHINVFLVASAPGSHFDMDWGMTRVGSLLRQHCCIPPSENSKWPLVAQASSIGSYGNDPKLWLTGDFLHHFTKIKNHPQMLSAPAELKLVYPSLENVQKSLDGLLGGGCLPYAAAAHSKQTWLTSFLYQWRATCSHRDRAMPHIKSYTRTSLDNKMAAYYLLTSGNISKAAWGSINKGNSALRIMSYEAGVLFLPKFVINEDLFPLSPGAKNRLIIPYDIPPTKYSSDMSPWVFDYLS
ncbi:probable tyrosyl-DNA phosphodiesterase [Achroia grisella]|uniref:probable tyrosyl-DNA phosphodiesterase n=1 Tax=Achroia grisella TaxID=688607 RepID=UPI0027D258B7|nr:probable tyrosyl-DNA phosphodiesterase [Achroia grisella]